MKHDWEYKKLGEVCTIERGGSPRPINNYITDDPNGVNWIKIGDAVDGSKYINSTKERIRPEGMKKSRFVHKGDFILSNSMSFGKPYILGVDGCIHDGWLVIHDDNDTFNKDFLYYYLGSPMMYRKFENLAVGGVVNNLNSQLVRSVSVPIPALAVQERIVGELDKVREVIEKKKEQLTELERLAGSMFYEMFGDPIENEKGWEVKCMNDVAPLSEYRGEHPDKDGKYWLLNLDKVESQTGRILDIDYYGTDEIGTSVISFDTSNVLYSKLRPYLNKVVIPNQIGYATSELVPLKPQKDILDRYYLAYMLRSNAFVSFINIKVVGAKMPRVSMGTFRGFMVPLPPLSLQQAFAEKVEAIEKQKELINQSIKEAQLLFDSRMEYWFGE